MTGRIGCCVPFCRRTRQNPEGFAEWLCGDHWRIIRKDRRRAYGRVARAWRRFRRPGDNARAGRLWSSLKREAVELAAGIR